MKISHPFHLLLDWEKTYLLPTATVGTLSLFTIIRDINTVHKKHLFYISHNPKQKIIIWRQ